MSFADQGELTRLEAEARYARDRHRLYKAKSLGPTLTDPGRLRALDRERARTETRLRRALTVPETN